MCITAGDGLRKLALLMSLILVTGHWLRADAQELGRQLKIAQKTSAPQPDGVESASQEQPLRTTDQSESSKTKAVAAALQELRKFKLALFARFEETPGGEITAVLNAGLSSKGDSKWAQRTILARGRGIPLLDTKLPLTITLIPKGAGRSRFQPDDVDGWKVRQLGFSGVDATGSFGFDWSPDGKILWLNDAKGTLYRVNAAEWEVDLQIAPPVAGPIRLSMLGSTCCAEGLAVLYGQFLPDRSSNATSEWTYFESAPEENTQNLMRLVILDFKTGRTLKSWNVTGDRLIGSPKSELIYLWRMHKSVIVINTRTGELVNVLRVDPARFDGSNRNPIHSLGPPTLSADVRWLLFPKRGPDSATTTTGFHSFRVDGARLIEEPKLAMETVAKSWEIRPGSEGQYVCQTATKNGKKERYIEDLVRRRLIGKLHENDTSGPQSAVNLMALEPVTKTVFLAGFNLPLSAVQAGKTTEFPFVEQPKLLMTTPARPGVMVRSEKSNYWIEGGGPEPKWDFEELVDSASLTFETPPDDSVVPEKPLTGIRTAPDRIEYPHRARWLDWAPDGKTFYMSDATNHLRQFDAEKLVELRHVPKIPVPNFQLLASGILQINGDKQVLRDLKTLRPLVDFKPLQQVIGHRTLDLFAGISSDELIVFDLGTRKVRVRTPVAIPSYRPGAPLGETSFVLYDFFPDGQRLLARNNEDCLAILHWPLGRIEVERIIPIPEAFRLARTATVDPSGRFILFDGQLIDLTLPGQEFQGERLASVGNGVTFSKREPHIGYFRDRNRDLWSIRLPERKLMKIASPKDGMEQTVPHPSEAGRFLMGSEFRQTKFGAVDRKLTDLKPLR